MIVAIGCDHAGFPLKRRLADEVRALGHRVLDVGAFEAREGDDYPLFARRVGDVLRAERAERGVLACGSGVGVSVAANKLPGLRAALCHDPYSAHQGVEHDGMNVLCLGARAIGPELAVELLRAFLRARFSGEERHLRRLAEIDAIERDPWPRPELRVLHDRAALAAAAADEFASLARDAIAARGLFTVALSGGSTPRPTYELLARDARVHWPRVHVFFGDERCVGPDDPESNYRLARETLLDRVAIPCDHVHRIRGEDDPDEAARAYERVLRSYFVGPEPSFDLALLGLGADGHTASLFPGTPPVSEAQRWVLPSRAEGATVPRRVTLTPPVLAAARHLVFLVAGAGKAAPLREVLDEPPARLLRPRRGVVRWLVDAAAAGRARRAA